MIASAIALVVAFPQRGNDVEVNAQDAAKIARRFAVEVGVKAGLKLKSVNEVHGEQWGFGEGQYYLVGFDLSDTRWAQAFVTTTGEIQLFQVVVPQNSLHGPPPFRSKLMSPDSRTQTDATTAMARRLLNVAHPTGSFTLRKFPGAQSGPGCMAYFDVTVAGHKFFNLNPTYAYRIDFDADKGEVTYFSRPPRVPPVNARRAKVGSTKAVSLLDHWAKTHYRTGGGAAAVYGPESGFVPSIVPELGYFKFKGEAKARLVWQGMIWVKFRSQPANEHGPLKMFVDAMTGELISGDDPLVN